MIKLILVLHWVAHGHSTVQSLAHITIRVQTLICTAPNPRLCGDGFLDNEGTRSGLAISSAYPTHTNLAFPSYPETRRMLLFQLYPPEARFVTCTHSLQVQITPSPLLRGVGGVTVCHFTRQYYLFPLLICPQWYHLPAGQYSLYELGR